MVPGRYQVYMAFRRDMRLIWSWGFTCRHLLFLWRRDGERGSAVPLCHRCLQGIPSGECCSRINRQREPSCIHEGEQSSSPGTFSCWKSTVDADHRCILASRARRRTPTASGLGAPTKRRHPPPTAAAAAAARQGCGTGQCHRTQCPRRQRMSASARRRGCAVCSRAAPPIRWRPRRCPRRRPLWGVGLAVLREGAEQTIGSCGGHLCRRAERRQRAAGGPEPLEWPISAAWCTANCSSGLLSIKQLCQAGSPWQARESRFRLDSVLGRGSQNVAKDSADPESPSARPKTGYKRGRAASRKETDCPRDRLPQVLIATARSLGHSGIRVDAACAGIRSPPPQNEGLHLSRVQLADGHPCAARRRGPPFALPCSSPAQPVPAAAYGNFLHYRIEPAGRS